MVPKNRLRHLLSQILNKKISEQELSELVSLTRSIAEIYIASRHQSLIILYSQSGLSVRDIAYDCIAEIFSREEQKFPGIFSFITSLQEPLEIISEKNLVRTFASYISTRTERSLARIFSEWDVVGARILRNIKESLQHDVDFIITNQFKEETILLKHEDILPHLEEYSIEALQSQLTPFVSTSENIPEILLSLREILCHQHQYRRTIGVTKLVLVIKNIKQHFIKEEIVESTLYQESQHKIILEQIRKNAQLMVHGQIVLYRRKMMITPREEKILLKTAHSILEQLLGEGDRDRKSYYDHMCKFTQITINEFEQHWHTKIKFLVKILHQSIRNTIKNNF